VLKLNVLRTSIYRSISALSHQHQYTHTHTHTCRNNFEEAVKGFETGKLINDGYFIVGGMKSSEGAVVSRDRNRNADTWRIDQNKDHGAWYVLETNYDHWEVVPTADDRRTPGNAHMTQLGIQGLTPENLYTDVMSVWPTFNPHTDVTCIMSAAQELFNCTAWLSQ
jgi:hypothetical protein